MNDAQISGFEYLHNILVWCNKMFGLADVTENGLRKVHFADFTLAYGSLVSVLL